MPFKPFRPPLIRKPAQAPQALHKEDEHQAKRRRINDSDDRQYASASAASSTVPIGRKEYNSVKPYRRPLAPVDVSPSANESLAPDPPRSDTGDGEAYYNVLWRRFTVKKHKTWDGDGILCLRGGYAYLQDISGMDMGRVMLNSKLEPGSQLSVGGKEVEIESVLSKESYLSGRPFLTANQAKISGNSLSTGPIFARQGGVGFTHPLPRTKVEFQQMKEAAKKTLNVSAPKSVATNFTFKNPLKENTVLLQKSGNVPVPRHDPHAPGAVVMKRPSNVPEGKQIVDVVLDPLLGKHLREHQREGVKFLYECVMGMKPYNGEGAILADEMGLGKTLQTIALLWTLLKQNPIYEAPPVIKRALIVCPVSLIDNWRKEFRKWLGNDRIGVFVADGKRTRLTDFTMGKSYSVMIIGYERLLSVHEELTKGSGIDIVIADEGHRLKTAQNKSAQAIQSLNTSRRIILSGTPIQNDLTEFFAMVDLVNPGLLGSFRMFMKEFEGPIVKSRQPGALKKDIEKGKAREEELQNLTSMFILRRTADILAKHLPPKTEYVLFCNPTTSQADVYRHVLASPIFQSALGNAECALQLITILKKICNSPSLLNHRTNDDESSDSTVATLLSTLPPKILRHLSPASSGKIRVLDQLLHNLHTTTDEKVVLISNYTSTLNILANLLTSLSLPFLRLDGSTPVSKRQGLVDDFNRSPASSCFAFLLSARAGGVGLNLTGASRLILFDVDWNPAIDMQAMARIHRDGQKRHCRIYRFILKGGLEEKIWQRQVTKIGLADSVMDQKAGVAQFSKEELKDLFRLDEDSHCQTHQLMQCPCAGRGEVADCQANLHASDDESEHNDNSDDLSPKLVKASQLEDSAFNPNQKGLKKMRSLMQYSHFDTAIFSGDNISSYRYKDPESISDNDSDNTLERQKLELERQIDDGALVSLLKEEGNGVGFLFVKKSAASVPVSAGAPMNPGVTRHE
ncbi:hypothetical protein VTO42DRAFT_692 [Malbranchea cinnamomea]